MVVGIESGLQYIRSATELHLNGTASLSSKYNETLEEFLKLDSSSQSSSSSVRTLYVYKVVDSEGEESVECSLDSTNNATLSIKSCIVFIRQPKKKLQMMVLVPDDDEEVVTDGGKIEQDEAKNDAVISNNVNPITDALFVYSKHVFLPTLSVSESLDTVTTKLRELDVSLQQVKRRGGSLIPSVQLVSHPTIVSAIESHPDVTDDNANFLDALGLSSNDFLQDDTFLNELQSTVNGWISQIQKVTVLVDTTPFPDRMLVEEISFWKSLCDALDQIVGEMSSMPVKSSIAVLKAAKRFLATIALENNTKLDSAIAHATDVTNYLKDMPIESMLSATEFTALDDAVRSMCSQIPKVRFTKHYPIQRVTKIIESISFSYTEKVVGIYADKLLSTKKHKSIMLAGSFEEFSKVALQAERSMQAFEVEYDQFCDFFLDFARKRGGSQKVTPQSMLKALQLSHVQLKERLVEISSFRNHHSKLLEVLVQIQSTVQSESDDYNKLSGAIREVEEAPLVFTGVDVLVGLTGTDSSSSSGMLAYSTALEQYELRIDAVETKIVKILQHRLTAADDVEEMFDELKRFQPLLHREKIQVSIRSYQQQLVENTLEAVKLLQNKFSTKYDVSEAYKSAKIRGIPDVGGKILWAKLMERQVSSLQSKMDIILGNSWGVSLEGRALKKACDELMAKLDARVFVRQWVSECEKTVTKKLNSRVTSYPIVFDTSLNAIVNTPPPYFRDIEYLIKLGYERDIPRTLTLYSNDLKKQFPAAQALETTLKSFNATRAMLKGKATLSKLVEPQMLAIREIMIQGFEVSPGNGKRRHKRIRWESEQLAEWVSKLASTVTSLEERTAILLETDFKATSILEAEKSDINIVASLQTLVDELSLAGYANLNAYVADMNLRLKNVLLIQLEKRMDTFSQDNVAVAKIEMKLVGEEIVCSPSVIQTKAGLFRHLYKVMNEYRELPQLSTGKYEVFDESEEKAVSKRHDSLHHLIDPDVLSQVYIKISKNIDEVTNFTASWIKYQFLWDSRITDVTEKLSSLEDWCSYLTETLQQRQQIDEFGDMGASVNKKTIGSVNVDYSALRSQIYIKYDSWMRELNIAFAEVLAGVIDTTLTALVDAKDSVEAVNLAAEGSSQPIATGVTTIQKTKFNLSTWKEEVVSILKAEKLLRRKLHFRTTKSNWIEGSRCEGALDALEQVLNKRLEQMKERLPTLQQRIIQSSTVLASSITEISARWDEEKPLRGSIEPNDALNSLATFEVGLKQLLTSYIDMNKAKEALELPLTMTTEDDSFLESKLEELKDIQEVWTSLQPRSMKLNELKSYTFLGCTPRSIRSLLEQEQAACRSLPARIRQYDAYNHITDVIKKYISATPVLNDLKTDALKDRHWIQILSRLGIKGLLKDVTVGAFWDAGIAGRRKELAEILSQAQGEMALENFINSVKDRWLKQQLSLALYQNRIRLIKQWDELFATLDDHMSGLVVMRTSSPYYRSVREFQEEGKLWEDRLTKLRALLDVWMDVQRRWVYLESIFFGSADIKAQLPSEYARFKSCDGEFVTIMRKISQRPYAMEALNIENLQRTLERLLNTMNIVQKALGDYLERQRSEFSRFYFLGDDDLLEIVGNASSGEPGKVLSHVGKMFAGITGAQYHKLEGKDGVELTHMVSKDGEVVKVDNAIEITPSTAAKAWLKQLEARMHSTLAVLLDGAVQQESLVDLQEKDEGNIKAFIDWASSCPAQVMILSTLINWGHSVTVALENDDSKTYLASVLSSIESKLEVMASTVLTDLPNETRKKFEQLITELVHQRDVTRSLYQDGVNDPADFRWLYQLRFNYSPTVQNLSERLTVRLSHASFFYGFEYLGIGERLVQTPLTDRCYLTLTQALHFRLGGSPFGPAGTGKTESVKALGAQLGRFVVVMNCDETFDFGAMGRLFCGLCQVGAWGCFDEFNRLEERILSAVSQQILTIQRGLLQRQQSIELLGRPIKLHENVGVFVTMNPGYAGRSNLPDNLKTLFRSVAMVVPDRKLIAQVMLFSQGIVSAEFLSEKVVRLFQLCEDKMSRQRHYDFGLRALKTLLNGAGSLKRRTLEPLEFTPEGEALATIEKEVLIEGASHNIVPKLVLDDLNVFSEIMEEVFPGSKVAEMEDEKLKEIILKICAKRHFTPGCNWLQKLLQLRLVLDMRHGVMMVGPVGVGKSSGLQILMEALEELDGIKGDIYRIDPKALDKEHLYGTLDGTVMEWTDGVFTHILRTILANQKGESDKRHWIVFDGDVDPEWAENLNSVLDDNKLLTLPSGERINLPNNIRIILEVDSLDQATPATVSRCGMVWFSDDTLSVEMRLEELIGSLSCVPAVGDVGTTEVPNAQKSFVEAIKPFVVSDSRSASFVVDAMDFCLEQTHVMEVSRERLLTPLKSLLIEGIQMAVDYDDNHPDFPIEGEHMEKFAKKWLCYSLLWACSASSKWDVRISLGDMLLRTIGLSLPDNNASLADYRVRVNDGEFELWSESVPRSEIESHQVTSSDVVITTTDTLRHTHILSTWLGSRTPIILCGPPGSGKTMTLTSVLQSFQGINLTSLNFSSGTSPEVILKTFAQYCTYVRRGKDVVLEPNESLGPDKWLVVFCDEINLPKKDAYGTQRVIMFMRQLIEQGGFWREDNVWVKTSRIQFVGACNPPTDAGREVMSPRFLRHAALLLVDFPDQEPLMQIYRTFNGGILKLFPNLKGDAEALTESMVEVYLKCQRQFTPNVQPQYFFSPRELSRWTRGIYEAVAEMDALTREELVRLWAHEALRLFSDRLVTEEETEWLENLVDKVARNRFGGVNHDEALRRPLFYSTWLSKESKRVERDELKTFLAARLRTFYEEELDVKLVVFDEVLEHVLRIDRVLRQPMGHCLLVGDSGTGKTVLSKFVSWMNGLSIFQIKAHSRYTLQDFNEDLRGVMRRVGIDGEKICFIFDEANALDAGFLEAMNALLASGEVPGLFEGDDYSSLMSACRDSAARDGVIIDEEEELWRRFVSIVQRNLHVVFTLNPSGGDWKNRSTTSPALFNRCVVDWFGTWSGKAMGEVARDFTQHLDLGDAEAVGGSWGIGEGESLMKYVEGAFEGVPEGGLKQAVVAALVNIHDVTKEVANSVGDGGGTRSRTFLSPRDFLSLIQNFMSCVNDRRAEVEEEQLRVNAGLEKLRQTQENVADLKASLGKKAVVLREKEALANTKLQQMVGEQKEAEEQKKEAVKMGEEVSRQQGEIKIRKEEAQKELDEAEPALNSAMTSVRGIKKRDLDEVRNLARPPVNVKLTLECVALMLGETKIEWIDIRKLLAKSDFIPMILNFDANSLTDKQIKTVQDNYIQGNTDLNVESVMRSSKACGPLYKWAESQIKYSSVYNRVLPLRQEVEKLEKEANTANEQREIIEAKVAELEGHIAQYKTDYAALIRDVEALKNEMETVTTKVSRAESLLTSLKHESDRWSHSSEGFQSVLRSLIGDGLLLSSFLTYFGIFDFKTRMDLMKKWKNTLDVIGIEYNEDLGAVESVSKESDRLKWQSQGLQSDSLSLENGAILDKALRYPLIIDPSGQAIEFVMNKYKDRKIQKTSFLDKAFMKTLAGAIRFGTALLVENVESIDPVLNPILNREIQRTGGRSLITIGTEDVDYSPSFTIILTTKNPAAKLTPDLCSRVTLINFTVTPASLESQSLSIVLRAEKPEVESQRAEILKLQGEQNVKLRDLEEQMLAKISAVEGSILDDDKVVDGMELLMKEGAQVEEQIAKSKIVMDQVEMAIQSFSPLASVCRKLFVLLDAMREVYFLYEFSSEAFIALLESVLRTEKTSQTDFSRMEMLTKKLFIETAARFGRGLLTDDKIVFALRLAVIYKGADAYNLGAEMNKEDLVSIVEEIFGSEFPWEGRGLNNLNEVVKNEVTSSIPVLLCSAPGHDVSGRIDALAKDRGCTISSIAMGSDEGFAQAENMVASAMKTGNWVLLKNCHLCTEWLGGTLVKKLQSATPHNDFRLFLTSEMSSKLPASLIRMSDIFIAEAQSGVKGTLSRFFATIPDSRFDRAERNRLYLLLGWTHAVVQERLRFVPSGWSEKYEFSEADASHALDAVDALLDNVSDGKRHLAPEKIPWDAIRSTLGNSIFGGRIGSDADNKILEGIVSHLFVAKSFDPDFALVGSIESSPTLPEITSTKDDCDRWISNLPAYSPPVWIGLEGSAEAVRSKAVANSIISKLSVVREAEQAD